MTRTSSRPEVVAVLDVGKTNVKLVAVAPDGRLLSSRSAPNEVRTGEPYPSCDTEHIWRWMMAALADLGERFTIAAIVPTSYGSTAALIDRADLVLPILDYEADPPPPIAAAYAEIAPWFEECCCPINPAGLTLGRQLFWQSRAFPDDVRAGALDPAVRAILGLGALGRPGLRGHLARRPDPALRPARRAISRRWRGARAGPTSSRRCATPGTSWGRSSSRSPRRCALPVDIPVLCGIHDSRRQFRPLSGGRPRRLHADLERHLADHLSAGPAAGAARSAARHGVEQRPARPPGGLRPLHGRRASTPPSPAPMPAASTRT